MKTFKMGHPVTFTDDAGLLHTGVVISRTDEGGTIEVGRVNPALKPLPPLPPPPLPAPNTAPITVVTKKIHELRSATEKDPKPAPEPKPVPVDPTKVSPDELQKPDVHTTMQAGFAGAKSISVFAVVPGIVVGQLAGGAGLANDTFVAGVGAPTGNVMEITLSKPTTAAISAGTAVTFSTVGVAGNPAPPRLP